MEINLFESVGAFAENKDVARGIRINSIIPALNRNEEIILNFNKIESATQSFIHALISDLIRIKGIEVLDRILFKNCNLKIKKIIEIVVEYMQEQS